MKTYGSDVFSYSPFGRQYVTRWNDQSPLASALMGNSPVSSGTTESPLSGTKSGESRATGASDFSQSNAPEDGGGGSRSGFSMPSLGGYGYGGRAGAIGSGLGLATGASGLGLVGNMIGTGFDAARANQGLASTGLPGLGVGGYLSGVANNASFGLLGNSIGSQWGNALNANSPYGMNDPQNGYSGGMVDPFGPQGTLADPYGGVDPNGNGGPSGGGEPGSSVDGSVGGGSGEVSGEGAPGGYAKGGHVKAHRLTGPNPKGPDDGYAALDVGEYVLRDAAAEKLGPEILDRLNSGKFNRAALARALMGKGK